MDKFWIETRRGNIVLADNLGYRELRALVAAIWPDAKLQHIHYSGGYIVVAHMKAVADVYPHT